MDTRNNLAVITGLLLGESGNGNESIEGSHKTKKIKNENFDWKMIET